ncbi:rifamycin-inactivating phosphotransferase [Actinoplanes sp. NBRC 103695]|uniref:rifamycin-inactivating phosphotransferase n=1 Tax=Actinoplanes sp. NBRC 103695 TaxID=3032202 RepID=UPI00249FA5DB|nr:rifamycin-inactivating phosphotransferase [Actinoplanes sp. NBRC 103695]GLY93813.1 putative phosphoenolpyruvate synthase [Actinoplanes sp. NBRC 103695]
MTHYILQLTDIRPAQFALAGGKGANLGELARMDGVPVPPGFVVTTDAFRLITPSIEGLLDRLGPGDGGAEIRRAIRAIPIPDEVAAEVTREIGEGAYAVRSSATAEDLPSASFAGQHDSYLGVVGPAAVLEHIGRCWASLFTERAISYRLRNGVDHRTVRMAVVVQRMAVPRVSGVLFTADPVTSNRKIASVDAVPGLGEALVSGLVNADGYQVRDGGIVSRRVAGQGEPTLTDAEVLRLVRLGRRIEAHFGRPQDIEWCLAGDEFQIVQSRPITTLFPIPEAGDEENHVYVSVGHQQMMTDPMKPLGISFWQMTTPRPMAVAGGRLFVDVTQTLAVPASRDALIEALGTRSDPLIGDALRTVVEREGFLPAPPGDGPAWTAPGSGPDPLEADPDVVDALIEQYRESMATLRREIRTRSGKALLDFIRADLQELKRLQFDPRSMRVIMSGMEAAWWLNDHMLEWLGEKNAADVLTQSVPHNVTSEMGLALLDVADAIRPYPEVVDLWEKAAGDDFLDGLPAPVRDALQTYLDEYGMRCVGEIDITRPRWAERPVTLLPLILANVRNFEPGAHRRLFEQGLRQAREKERDLLTRLRDQPDGERKAAETKKMIDRVRTFSGYREYPKYHMISRYWIYKQALLAEYDEDIFFLSFDELPGDGVDARVLREREEAHESYRALTPPRVLTSDGEAVTGSYRREGLPEGALAGMPVSAGTVEGRARVVRDLAEADLAPGDILVTAFTDPSWTPSFVTVAGLVTEVGGLMTHGAVIAREYGLPAVVGVEQATRLIPDGQRIRVHGADGYVELLGDLGT